MTLRAPFPWFGGKSRVADLVWARFGDVPNYVEPFAGSLAVLLGRPHTPRTETVNDLDCYLANFWRALQADPDEVARHADWPVNENDLHARHAWLVGGIEDFTARMEGDPDFYDARVAGWWVWGLSAWIGSGWCSGLGPWRVVESRLVDTRQLPHLAGGGRGITRQLPHLSGAGQGINATGLGEYMVALSGRLRSVRVACGSWERVLGASVTFGTTAVFLDPPYGEDEHTVTYAAGTGNVAADVREWAIANGDNPAMRIAMCGYAGEHDGLEVAGWSAVRWKARGGYGSQSDGQGRENAARETVWFSPHCLPVVPHQTDLLEGIAA